MKKIFTGLLLAFMLLIPVAAFAQDDDIAGPGDTDPPVTNDDPLPGSTDSTAPDSTGGFEEIPTDILGTVTGLPGQIKTATTTEEVFALVINFVLGFVGLITLFFLILGGYYYITAQGEEAQMEKGKKIVIGAVIGMVLIVGSYTLVYSVLNFIP